MLACDKCGGPRINGAAVKADESRIHTNPDGCTPRYCRECVREYVLDTASP